MQRVKNGLLALLVALVLQCWTTRASAQSWVSDVQLSFQSGFEGGGSGYGVSWQRARTRLVVGFDLGNDEHAAEAYGARAFVELERSIAVGVELGYVRWVIPQLNLFFGGVAVLTPDTLFGGTVGATYIIPLGKVLGVAACASFSALPLGSDLPDNGVLVWAMLGIGVRGRL
jgi:hypothetical protein